MRVTLLEWFKCSQAEVKMKFVMLLLIILKQTAGASKVLSSMIVDGTNVVVGFK
jgi:hypothetical protein